MAIEQGISRVDPRVSCVLRPISDGGEGFLSCILGSREGREVEVEVLNVLGRRRIGRFATLTSSSTAVIEAAEACGLGGLERTELDVYRATSFGVGQLIAAAVESGVAEIVVGLGGTATNDGGLGCLQALGYQLMNDRDEIIESPAGGKDLVRVAGVDVTQRQAMPQQPVIRVACDVGNPLLGKTGATKTFASQKGATALQIEQLEAGMQNWANVIRDVTGREVATLSGAGAAGGLAAGLLVLEHATLEPGIDLVLDTIRFNQDLESFDLVITGEGQMDAQTAFGKAPFGVCRRAKAAGLPVLGLAGALASGANELFAHGFDVLESAVCRPMSLGEAVKNAHALLADAAERSLRAWLSTK